MSSVLRDIVARNRAGEAVAIPSVCTAHPTVLRAALNWAKRNHCPIVIEATSNQVNQDGGYTGQTPAEYATNLHSLAAAAGLDREQLVLGGDHLGPQAWRKFPAEQAMAKATTMVEAYVRAGFGKIHLDCSEGCAGEQPQLPDEVTADRSAQLAKASEVAANGSEILYVIGTEVPPPGGARKDESGDIPPTTPDAAMRTLDVHEEALKNIGLSGLRERVAGLVVQPGVEFTPTQVHQMPLDRDPGLRQIMMHWPNLCLEAHSTDYQRSAAYHRLAELGFAFQKVGPALTFAYRQAVYALDYALSLAGRGTGIDRIMDDLMQTEPSHWQGYYAPDDRLSRHVGLSDRIRYYWPMPKAREAVASLLAAVSEQTLPDPVLWQVFGSDVLDRADILQGEQAQRLVDAQIEAALDHYNLAGQGVRHV